jgi:hypothetical protein
MRGPRRLLNDLRYVVRTFLQQQRDVAVSVGMLAEIREHLSSIQQRDMTEVAKALGEIQQHLASIRVHTWHGKETPHAGLLGALIAADGRYADPLYLARHHAQVYSQNGEDGIVAEIFSRIGTSNRFFVEIGAGDGRENNTRFLLEQGWHGLWIDASVPAMIDASQTFAEAIQDRRLTLVQTDVSVANVNQIMDDTNVPDICDFVSIDIDFNTPHIWNAMTRRSRVACIEYNGNLPPSADLSVPYEPTGSWDGTNWYGASLKALERIGADKDLALVGCDLLGVNAFFVSTAEAQDRFREPFTAEHHYELPRYTLASHIGHPPSRVARKWQSMSAR